jgi:hypothetical protein
MQLSFWPLWFVLVLVFLFGVSIWWMVVALMFYIKSKEFVYSRGANGISGGPIQATCPVGKKISFQSAFLECTDLNSKGTQPSCDPYNNDGSVNKSNTQDVLSQLQNECDGMQTCSFQVPFISGACSGCNGSQLVAKYLCK